MVVSMPRKGLVRTEAPDMVRVQLKDNDIRSYRRADAEEILAQSPGAFIIGEQPEDDAAEAAPKPSAKAQRTAPNKARQPKSEPAQTSTAPAETKSNPPADPTSDGQPPVDPPKAD